MRRLFFAFQGSFPAGGGPFVQSIMKNGGYEMNVNVKKLAVSAMLVAVAVSLSSLSIPIGASKCFPVQHLANVIAGVFLGP